MKTFGKNIKIDGLGKSKYTADGPSLGGEALINMEGNPWVLKGILAPIPDELISKKDRWNVDNYERAVLFHLKKLNSSKVGSVILGGIREHIDIIPYARLSNNADALRHRIRFTPGLQYTSNSIGFGQNTEELIQKGDNATTTLLHELVHSVSFQLGLPDDNWTNNDYDDLYEFVAILATNIYRSEQRFTKIRMSHHGHVTKSVTESNFLSDPRCRNGMLKFMIFMPKIFHDIAKIDTKWNPIRLYVQQFSRMTM